MRSTELPQWPVESPEGLARDPHKQLRFVRQQQQAAERGAVLCATADACLSTLCLGISGELVRLQTTNYLWIQAGGVSCSLLHFPEPGTASAQNTDSQVRAGRKYSFFLPCSVHWRVVMKDWRQVCVAPIQPSDRWNWYASSMQERVAKFPSSMQEMGARFPSSMEERGAKFPSSMQESGRNFPAAWRRGVPNFPAAWRRGLPNFPAACRRGMQRFPVADVGCLRSQLLKLRTATIHCIPSILAICSCSTG
jgi:hypothetical protein